MGLKKAYLVNNSPSRIKPFGRFERMIAMRYIGATKSGAGVSLISIIAFLGITLAVMTLIIVMAVMQGFQSKLLEQLLGVNGHAFIEAGYDEILTSYEDTLTQLTAIEGVVSAIPIVKAPVYAAANGETGVFVNGIRSKDLRDIELIAGDGHLLAGSLDKFGEGRNGGKGIAIGTGLAQKLGVGLGDGITLITGSGTTTPFGPTPRSKTYNVEAIFSIGMSEYDSLFVYMPLRQAQLFFGRGDAIDAIEIKIDRPQDVEAYLPALEAVTPQANYLYDWRRVHKSYFNALQTERAMMRIILSLIVLIAVLNIITGLVMLVKDKTGDIAVMRTMGATKGAILRVFFMSGSLIGVIGTFSGVVLGALICDNIASIEDFFSLKLGIDLFPADIYYLDHIPAEMQAMEVVSVAAFALIMSFISTLYPAWRASALDPVEALRYE